MIADIGLGVGIAGVVTGALLWALADEPASERGPALSVAPALGPAGVGSLTLTSILPMLAAVNSPLRASTHDSMPSTMCSRCTRRPSCSHLRSAAKAVRRDRDAR